ncbi:hypothetical protein RG42_20115 [Escherichia coli]|nr:hypothetical protein RG42_20115 [Escherichia coli]
MPESLMVIRSSSTLRKHWEWMTFSADSVSSVHTLTDDLPLESLADQPGAGNVHLLIPPEGLLYRSLTLPNAKYKLTALKWSTKTGHRVRVFSSIDFPIRLVVTHHYIRAVLVRCNIQRYSPLLRELHR